MANWSAKPSGGYDVNSTEASGNIENVNTILAGYGYTPQAVAGVLGNVQAESGFNPWRWQSDRVSSSGGYGLFQYTPATGYTSLESSTPNLSTTEQTSGATTDDGANQVRVFASNTLRKWVSTCWRSYWSKTDYADLYAYRSEVLRTWGNGSSISMTQLSRCTDIRASAFIFLACFEGPAVPNLETRVANAQYIYDTYLSDEPTPPTPPDPPQPPIERVLPIWLYSQFNKGGF